MKSLKIPTYLNFSFTTILQLAFRAKLNESIAGVVLEKYNMQSRSTWPIESVRESAGWVFVVGVVRSEVLFLIAPVLALSTANNDNTVGAEWAMLSFPLFHVRNRECVVRPHWFLFFRYVYHARFTDQVRKCYLNGNLLCLFLRFFRPIH